MYNQLNNYLEQNNLYSIYQSAYRKDHSCESSLFKLVNGIQTTHAKSHNTILILLDQSAAFDTIDHQILLTKLQTKFGISGNALKLIQSYLENRSFSVKINDCLGSPKRLRYGVPQGSLVKPLFYILHVKVMKHVLLTDLLRQKMLKNFLHKF